MIYLYRIFYKSLVTLNSACSNCCTRGVLELGAGHTGPGLLGQPFLRQKNKTHTLLLSDLFYDLQKLLD